MIGKIAVVGSGYMGGGIAQVLALAGHEVQISDVSAEHAARSLERIIGEAADYAERGLFPHDAAERVAAFVTAAESIEQAVSDADFVEEAVPEILAVKHETLARVSASARPDALIGSNTSTISIATLAEAVHVPERFLGVHFSNPAPFIPGVEVIPHAGTRPGAAAEIIALLAGAGKLGVEVKDVTGFVVNRLQYALFTEASRLVEEGVASVEDIDMIARTTFGHRLPFFGPFAIADMAGLDVYAFCYRSLEEGYPDRFVAPAALTERVADGALGVKSGRGFLATPPDELPAVVAYRDSVYAAMSALLAQVGKAPVTY